jgi:hypothetical protein
LMHKLFCHDYVRLADCSGSVTKTHSQRSQGFMTMETV